MAKIFTFLILILFVGKIYSQRQVQTGLIIGYNSSTYLGNDRPGKGLNPIPGFYIGGIVNYPLTNRFEITSNVALTSRGTKINTINEINEMVLLLYLDVPVMVRMRLLPEKKISPFAEFGGAFDINILAIGANGPYYDIKKVDLGMVSGLGLEAGKISFQIRYYYGLTRFDKSQIDSDLRNSTISILLGLTF